MGLDMEFLFLFLKRCSGGRKIISSGRKYILSGRHWAWAGAGGGALSENVGYICAALKSIISRLSAKASYSLGYHFTHESQDQSFLRVSFSGHIIFFLVLKGMVSNLRPFATRFFRSQGSFFCQNAPFSAGEA